MRYAPFFEPAPLERVSGPSMAEKWPEKGQNLNYSLWLNKAREGFRDTHSGTPGPTQGLAAPTGQKAGGPTKHTNKVPGAGLSPWPTRTYITKLKSEFAVSVLDRVPAKLGPKTPLNRSGSSHGVERT